MRDKVTVAVRCRPTTTSEKVSGETLIDLFGPNSNKLIRTSKNQYEFAHVLQPASTQDEVYEVVGQTIVENVLKGYNGTILAYGQTGSGKSYSMGTDLKRDGLTQRVLNSLFKTSEISIIIRCVEIYREEIFDLLSPMHQRLTVSQGLKAIKTVKQIAHNVQDAQEIIQLAIGNRRMGATKANINSSRSHMVITFSITSEKFSSKLNLVDLAGSEKVSDNDISRNEGVAINSGLLHLLRVFDNLSKGEKFVPYRDSKLTYLLKDSLSPSNYIALIACINSLNKNLEETDKTLDFASKCANIDVTPLMSSQIFGTPYKTPRKATPRMATPRMAPLYKYQNKTFCTSAEIFKKPLAPLNHTVASPMGYAANRREGFQSFATPRISFRTESPELSLSNVSTSTALSDRGSPEKLRDPSCTQMQLPPDFQMLIKSAVEAAAKESDLRAEMRMKSTVDATVKATEKRMKHLFRRQLAELGLFKNEEGKRGDGRKWDERLSAVEGLDDSPDSVSSNDTSTDELENTVLGVKPKDDTPKVDKPASSADHDIFFKKPDIPPSNRSSSRPSSVRSENLNGSFISSDNSNTSNSRCNDADSESGSGMKKRAPRRSVRLSILKKPRFIISESDKTSDETSDSEISSRPNSSSPYRAPRRSVRLSLCKRPLVESSTNSDGASPKAKVPRRVVIPASAVKSSAKPKPKAKREREPKLSSVREEGLSQEDKILRILNTGGFKDLRKLPKVGEKTAQLIINHRLLRGCFEKISDFKDVRGLTRNQAQNFLWANNLDEV